MRDLTHPVHIKFGDGKVIDAAGSGQVTTPIGKVDALFVPGLCANLLSVLELNTMGANVCFFPNNAEINYRGKLFGVSVIGNIFRLDEVSHCYFSSQNTLNLWNQRLGHLNLEAVKSYLSRFDIRCNKPDDLLCHTCSEAKLTRSKFIHRNNYVKSVLSLLK